MTDGPFTEAKEIVGGYWMIQVRSREEAIAWASRCPLGDDEIIELRQVFEMDDFGIDPSSEQIERLGSALPWVGTVWDQPKRANRAPTLLPKASALKYLNF